MRTIKLTLRYDGSAFHGWQYQPNCITVEEEIKKALFQILREDIKIQSCSRTDAGVHADMFCCSFRTETDRSCDKIILGLNAVLPETVAVYGCEDVPEDFHARYSCAGKEYIYKIWNGKERNPFLRNYALHFPRRLDEKLLDKEAKDFVGTYDFSSFCASGATVQSKVRTVFTSSVERDGDIVIFKVTGDGFLYNMVRIMVGTLLDISDGKIEKNKIKEIINSKDREKAGKTAPPEGLYLGRVFYDKGGLTDGK